MIRFFFWLIFSAILINKPALSQDANPWTKASNGLEYRKIILSGSAGLDKEIVAVRISSGKQGVKVLRAQDFGKRTMNARDICTAAGALLCINSSFFDEKSNPLGLLISSGITFQKPHQGGETLTGVFAATRKSFVILGRDESNTGLLIEAVQAGPRLVINGKALEEFKDKEVSRRSGVCVNEKNVPIFFATSEDSWAVSLKDFAQAMVSPDVGCQDGLNLDGGGSAQLFLRASSKKSADPQEYIFDIRGQDQAPVFLAVIEGLRF